MYINVYIYIYYGRVRVPYGYVRIDRLPLNHPDLLVHDHFPKCWYILHFQIQNCKEHCWCSALLSSHTASLHLPSTQNAGKQHPFHHVWSLYAQKKYTHRSYPSWSYIPYVSCPFEVHIEFCHGQNTVEWADLSHDDIRKKILDSHW